MTNGAYDQPRFLITIIHIGRVHIVENRFDPFGVCMREHSPERIDRGSDGGFCSELVNLCLITDGSSEYRQ